MRPGLRLGEGQDPQAGGGVGGPEERGVVVSGRFAVGLQRVGGLYPAGLGRKEINIRRF